jgi:hypothetical protein
MGMPRTVPRTFVLWVGLAMLFAGCSENPPGAALNVPGWVTPNAIPLRTALGAPHTTVESSGRADSSWMSPEAKGEDLLYATNVYTVTVYSYPSGKHVGTLRGFYRPEFECSDKKGNVFITEGGLVEYPHGGTKQIGSFTMGEYFANDCASDPTTGDLAIAWEYGHSKSYLAVYHNGSSTPTLYSKDNMQFFFCGYDSAGNLFADGFNPRVHGHTVLAELPKGGAALKMVTLPMVGGGPVQWDGKYVAVGVPVGTAGADTIYRLTISGSTAKLEGKARFEGAQTLIQWWIDGGRVIGPDDGPSKIWYWDYPKGGSPTKVITKAVFHPAGVTVSRASP